MYNLNNVKKDNYTIDDCLLIRTTDIYPQNHIVQTPKHGHAYSFGSSVLFSDLLISRIKSKYPNVMSSQEEKEFEQVLREYDVFFSIPRSTIHFTINGLVGSHEYGSFDNRPFIIIEPLKNQIDNPSLEGIRTEDTYFSDDLVLSKDAVIMIPKWYYDSIDSSTIKSEYNVFVFEGKEIDAISYVLNSLGYNAFIVGKHGYVKSFMDQNDETNMTLFIRNFAHNNNLKQDKHCYSEIYKDDYITRYKANNEEEREYLRYIVDNSILPDDLLKKISYYINNLSDISDITRDSCIEQLLDIIELDNLKKLTKEYNQICIEKNKQLKEKNTIVKQLSMQQGSRKCIMGFG